MNFERLGALYDDLGHVVRRGGFTYPAAFAPQHAEATGLTAITGEALWVDPTLRAGGKQHLERVARRSPGMHDGRVMAYMSAEGFPITCAPGGYFDAIATSDSLRAEFIERSLRLGPTSVSALEALPLRQLAHAAAGGDPLRSGRGRVAAVGVSVALTIPGAPVRALVLGLRNDEVATDPGVWHVAPSGTLEPTGRDAVIALVELELFEEVGVRLAPPSTLASRLKTLGIGFDLLRLRPEVCLRLDLQEREIAPGGPSLSTREFRSCSLLELSEPSLRTFWGLHPPSAITPAAAATIALIEAESGRPA